MPPDLELWLTLISLNYPCLEHIFIVPKVFESFKFYCICHFVLSVTIKVCNNFLFPFSVHQNQNSVRPLLPLPPKSASTQSSEIPQTVAIKTSAGQIIIPKQYIPVSLAVTPPGTLALPPGVSVRPQTVVPQQTSVSQQMSVSQQTTVSQQMSVAQQTPSVSRTPVTQILHQTLTQRQALQKQTNMTPQG